jgi:hypothetical protein
MFIRRLLFALALVVPPAVLAAEPTAPTKLEATGPSHHSPSGTQAVPAKELKVQASSMLCEGKGAKRTCHGPERLVDGENGTAWCEGAKEDGVGESVTFELQAPQEVVALEVVPFYAKDMRRANGNARPDEVVLEIGTQRFEVAFPDHVMTVLGENPEEGPSVEDGPCGDETCVVTQDERIGSGERFTVTLPAPVKAQKVRLELRSTHAGEKHSDTCMSEVTLHVRRAPPAKPQ